MTGQGWIGWLPGILGGWTQVRDLQEMPKETFREWLEKRGGTGKVAKRMAIRGGFELARGGTGADS